METCSAPSLENSSICLTTGLCSMRVCHSGFATHHSPLHSDNHHSWCRLKAERATFQPPRQSESHPPSTFQSDCSRDGAANQAGCPMCRKATDCLPSPVVARDEGGRRAESGGLEAKLCCRGCRTTTAESEVVGVLVCQSTASTHPLISDMLGI